MSKPKFKAVLNPGGPSAIWGNLPPCYVLPATPEAYEAQRLAAAQTIRRDFGHDFPWKEAGERSRQSWLKVATNALAAIGIRQPKKGANE